MSVDDFGIEVLKKASEELVLGVSGKREYVLRIRQVDENGVAYSPSNPLPTSDEASTGEEILDPFSSDVDGQASDDHEYLVPADKVFNFEGIRASSSALVKLQISYALDGLAFVALGTRFNDRPPGLDVDYPRGRSIPAGGVVRITRLNRQNPGDLAEISTTILGLLRDAS